MGNPVENYLFLGPPKSGKTTFLSLMLQHLQVVANHAKHLRFLRCNETTSDIIDESITRISQQRWPRKTACHKYGSFELDKYHPFMGHKYFYRMAVINCHDYPGEAFEAAFVVNDYLIPDEIKAASRIGDDISLGNFREADDMKSQIKKANGMFLVIDAEELLNGRDEEKNRDVLTRLVQYIRHSNRGIKLAVIFNKLELLGDHQTGLIAKIKKDYSNAYAYLPHNHKFFYVYPLGNVDAAEDGAIIPPRRLHPRGILAPIRWMIGF